MAGLRFGPALARPALGGKSRRSGLPRSECPSGLGGGAGRTDTWVALHSQRCLDQSVSSSPSGITAAPPCGGGHTTPGDRDPTAVLITVGRCVGPCELGSHLGSGLSRENILTGWVLWGGAESMTRGLGAGLPQLTDPLGETQQEQESRHRARPMVVGEKRQASPNTHAHT